MKRFRQWSLVVVQIIVSAKLFAAPEHRLTRDFWTSPEFVRSFMGDYGFRTEVEPKITRSEQQMIGEVVAKAQQDLQEAITYLAGKTSLESSAALDFALATMHFQSDRLGRAAVGYEQAIRKFPNFLRAHKNLGYVLIRQGDFDDAAEHLAKALSLGEGDGVTFVALGYCHYALERYVSAENAYRMAILRVPENKEARNGLVNCLLATDRHREALALLDELLERNPGDVFCHRARANTLIALDKPKKAAVALEILRRMDQLDLNGLLLLGDVYHNLDLHSLSLDDYQEALQKQGNLSPDRFMRVAAILIDRGSYKAAFDYLERIEKKFDQGLSEEENLRLLSLKAKVLLTTGKEAQAAEILRNILSKNPLDGRALLLLGRLAWKEGDHATAAINFERAAKVQKYEADAAVEHARMKVESRKYAEAVELLERAQFVRPRDNVGRYLESVRNALAATRAYR
ncbi:MAG: tetratricopeptide repeat protein [Verrucomicrobia bacterium]|nr:tetratricopeptide repeat protein [Verrucomicrobiota bacterium]MDA1048385.1 tetratricopeptide repeat protein [Verrucomicrobiota bacterium]